MTTKEEWMMAATEARGERDEALAALEDLYTQLEGMGVHRVCYETAEGILIKHGRLPAAGGAE